MRWCAMFLWRWLISPIVRHLGSSSANVMRHLMLGWLTVVPLSTRPVSWLAIRLCAEYCISLLILKKNSGVCNSRK